MDCGRPDLLNTYAGVLGINEAVKAVRTLNCLGLYCLDLLFQTRKNIDQVKMTLLSHRSTSALNTSVTTQKDEVTLGGKAKNAAEKDLATKLANDVNGLKGVKNRMTIE